MSPGVGDGPVDPVAALREECELVSLASLSLSEADFAKPTRCEAWNVKELLAHMYRDVDRANVALSEPEPPAADTDAISYWRAYDPATDGPPTAERAKELAAAYATGRELALAWDEMWRRSLEAVSASSPSRVVRTWEPALALEEFVKTRVLEITVHRMDLEEAFGRKGWGTDRAIGIVDDILAGLLGEDPPRDLDWDVVEFIEVGTGRRALTEREREILGPLAGRFPLLG